MRRSPKSRAVCSQSACAVHRHKESPSPARISRSGAADYDQIQKMFLFESFQLYGIIAHVLTYSAHRREVVRAAGSLSRISTPVGSPPPIPALWRGVNAA